ncbi:MAG: hypothetical protein EBR82_82230 [Caulobacteraceae bacterium]|nr:hypothetical protein [Caulobacteraceae bacterium]
MAKYSMKKGGKEVGPASTYAEPHTMQGKKTKVEANPGFGPDHSDSNTIAMSVGTYTNKLDKPVKTSGIKMRGAGAATKGTMSRGPMA